MLSIFLFNGQLAIASIYRYIFMVCLGDPRFGLLLKTPVLLDLLEDGKVTKMGGGVGVLGGALVTQSIKGHMVQMIAFTCWYHRAHESTEL